jgi:hypothetical protein
MKKFIFGPLALVMVGTIAVRAADDAATTKTATTKATPPKAARSVHLSYLSEPASEFYAEVTVEKTVPGSYFQVCGFSGGYFGIQDHGNGKKVGIFSVWDSGKAKGNDPKAIDNADRVQTLFVGPDVRANRFGGEGTGGHSDFDFSWNVGDTYRFYLVSKIENNRTIYSAYIFQPDKKSWMHVATFSAPDGGKHLTGLYSFIEDFRRDTRSATEVRKARFGNQWIKTLDGKWVPLTKAHFTGSSASWEAKTTINAGTEGKQFFLQTGGDTVEQTKLHDVIERSIGDEQPPTDLPKIDP